MSLRVSMAYLIILSLFSSALPAGAGRETRVSGVRTAKAHRVKGDSP